jgi:SpoVK/Ycf46/Vps4 family AAA+-type ATPase
MQEKKSQAFIVATANDITKLPPEMLRKGRFDEVFFIDLPTHSEALAILKILCNKYRHPELFDIACMDTDVRLVGLTGAEIEGCVVEALELAFAQGSQTVNPAHLKTAIQNCKPLSVLSPDSVKNLREWAKGKARRASAEEGGSRGTREILA